MGNIALAYAFLLIIELKASEREKTMPNKALSKGFIQSLLKSKGSCFGCSNGLHFIS